MSRTFRRKKKKPNDYITHNYQRVGEPLTSNCGNYRKWEWLWLPYEGKELKEQIAKYHTSDNHSGIHAVPSWFTNLYFQRPRRRKEKAQLRYMLVSGDYYDYCFSLHKKNAGWDWW